MKIRPVGAELFHENRRTDGQTDKQTNRQTDRHDEVNSRYIKFLRKRLKTLFSSYFYIEATGGPVGSKRVARS